MYRHTPSDEVYRDMETYDPAAERIYEGKRDSLLHRAVQYCNFTTVSRLLQLGANVNATNEKRETPVHYAARRRTQVWETLMVLTKFNARYDTLDQDRNLPLHYAVANPECDMLGLAEILTHRLDVNIQNRLGKTALHVALEQDHCPPITITYLVICGANLDTHTAIFNYPFHCAVQSRKCNAEILDTLAYNSADVNAINSVGDTPLSHALRNPKCNFGSIEALLKNGALLEPMNEESISALGQSARYSCPIKIIEFLFFKGAIVNCGVHPVVLAIKAFQAKPSERRMKIVKLFIRYCILENVSYDVDGMITECNGPPQLLGFAESCAEEIHAMYSRNFGTNVSVLDIVHADHSVDCVLEGLLEAMAADEFPLYLREISYHVPRKVAEEQFRRCAVHTYAGDKIIALCYDIVLEIVQHLKNDHDVICLLVSFYSFKAVDILPVLITEESEVLQEDPMEAPKSNTNEKSNKLEQPPRSSKHDILPVFNAEVRQESPKKALKRNPKEKSNKVSNIKIRKQPSRSCSKRSRLD